jgi:hypothetical protein
MVKTAIKYYARIVRITGTGAFAISKRAIPEEQPR